MNYGFVIDNRKCIGCHACTVACKSEHEIPVGVNRTHVKYVEKGVFPQSRRTFTVTRCNHCEDAPCVEICPTSALFTRRDGIVDFDSDRCIACRSCMQACPYDALYIDPETQTAAKCNYCAHRIEKGYQPACVIVCPVQAIVSGDLHDPSEPISQLLSREEVSLRKPEKGTRPNVYYIDGDHAALNPLAAVPSDSYFTSEQQGGVGHFAHWLEARREPGSEALFHPLDEAEPVRRAGGGVSLAGSISLSQRAVDDVGRELAQEGRRVYDAPDKGILWGWQVPAYIWAKAVAAGLLLVWVMMHWIGDQPTLHDSALTFGFSLVFLGMTGLLLIADLDRPDRFHYVMLRPNWSSWLVRGAYIISGLGLWLGLSLAGLWGGWRVFSWWWIALAATLALLGATYTAFLFAQAKGRDFWQSPLSPLRMLNHAVLAGAAFGVLLGLHGSVLSDLMLVCLIVNLVLLLLELWMPHASEDAAMTVRLIQRGPDSMIWWSGIALGTGTPLLIFLAQPGFPLIHLGAVLAMAGVFLTEWVWVRTPQRIPLA